MEWSKKEKTDISIIIPCYNTDPLYLKEAIESVCNYKGKYRYELIIVNDGSVHIPTLEILEAYKESGIKIIHQKNQGPSATRNNGVKFCNGDYLLLLDSDNKIRTEYIDEGINALNQNKKLAVAYGKPNFIGETSRSEFKTGPFIIQKLLTESYIDMCAVVRKQAWQQVNGLDENLTWHEDWEFWLRLYKAGWQFIYLDKVLFDYRIRTGSLMSLTNKDSFEKIISYIYKKHWDLVYQVFYKLHTKEIIYQNDVKRPFRSFLKYLKLKLAGKSFGHNS